MSTNTTQQAKGMYFPPPPLSVTLPKSKVRTMMSRKPSAKSFSNDDDDDDTRSSHCLLSPRHGVLLLILLLSFSMLILGTIFANCVALPHTDKDPGSFSYFNSTDDVSSQRDSTLGGLLRRSDSDSVASNDAFSTMSPTNTNTNTTAASANATAAAAAFSTGSAIAALFFYTATLPFLTLLHTSTELLVLLIKPSTLNTSPRSLSRMRRILPRLSLCACVLLLLGWIPMSTIWLNCEVTPLGSLDASQAICPIQIRGHRMGGISEVSAAKSALSFATVLLYAGYALFMALRVVRKSPQARTVEVPRKSCVRASGGLFKRRMQRKARFLDVLDGQMADRGGSGFVVIGLKNRGEQPDETTNKEFA